MSLKKHLKKIGVALVAALLCITTVAVTGCIEKDENGETEYVCPEHRWDGTKISFKNPDDTWGNWVDLVGPIGQRGIPGLGIPGPPGLPGVDCTDNYYPVVTADIECNHTKHTFTSTILASVDDPDDDNMHITISHRISEEDDWDKIEEYIGADGDYSATVEFNKPKLDEVTNYWRIESWDGSDIALDYFECMATPEL